MNRDNKGVVLFASGCSNLTDANNGLAATKAKPGNEKKDRPPSRPLQADGESSVKECSTLRVGLDPTGADSELAVTRTMSGKRRKRQALRHQPFFALDVSAAHICKRFRSSVDVVTICSIVGFLSSLSCDACSIAQV